jgi:hypothetical protein
MAKMDEKDRIAEGTDRALLAESREQSRSKIAGISLSGRLTAGKERASLLLGI